MTNHLNPRQQRFVQEYLVDFNATQAAIRAGYSRKTARIQASQMLRNDKVQKLVAQHEAQACERNDITIDLVLSALSEIAFPGRRRVRHGDRLRALEMLGRHLGMFVDRHRHEGADGTPVQINFALPRAGSSPIPDIPIEHDTRNGISGGVPVPPHLQAR